MLANVCTRRARIAEVFEKKRIRMAGTTGLEPATSDVTGLRSGSAESATYLCFQWSKGDKLRQGAPSNAAERYLHFTPTSRAFVHYCGIERKPASLKRFGSLPLPAVGINFREVPVHLHNPITERLPLWVYKATETWKAVARAIPSRTRLAVPRAICSSFQCFLQATT